MAELNYIFDERLKAVDKNLRDSFLSVKKDILEVRKSYDIQLSDLSKQISAFAAGEERMANNSEGRISALEQEKERIQEILSRITAVENEISNLGKSDAIAKVERAMYAIKKASEKAAAEAASKRELAFEKERAKNRDSEINLRISSLTSSVSSSINAAQAKLKEQERAAEKRINSVEASAKKSIKESEKNTVEKSVSQKEFNAETEALAEEIGELREYMSRIGLVEKNAADFISISQKEQNEIFLLKKRADNSSTKTELKRASAKLSEDIFGLKSKFYEKAKQVEAAIAVNAKNALSKEEFEEYKEENDSIIEEDEKNIEAISDSLSKKIESLRNRSVLKDQLSRKIAAVNSQIGAVQKEARKSYQEASGRINEISAASVPRENFADKIDSVSDEISEATDMLSKRAESIKKSMDALSKRSVAKPDFEKEKENSHAEINSVRKDFSRGDSTLNKAIDSIRKKNVSVSEFNKEIDSINNNFTEVESRTDAIEGSFKKKIEGIESASVQKGAFLGKTRAISAQIEEMKKKSSELSRRIEHLSESKVEDKDFQNEYSYLEEHMLNLSKSVEALQNAKKEIERLEAMEPRLSSLEENAVLSSQLNQKAGKISRRITELSKDIDDISSGLRNTHEEISELKDTAVLRDAFELEMDKCEVRSRRGTSEAKKISDNLVSFQEEAESKFIGRQEFENSIARIEASLRRIEGKASQVSEIPALQARIDSLKRELSRAKAGMGLFVTKGEFYASNSSIKARYYEIKQLIERKISEMSWERRRILSQIRSDKKEIDEQKEDFVEKKIRNESEKKIELQEQITAPEEKEEKPRKKGLSIFSKVGMALYNFFTVEEEEKPKAPVKKESKKKNEKEKNGSKISYLLILFLLVFTAAVLIAINAGKLQFIFGAKNVTANAVKNLTNATVKNVTAAKNLTNANASNAISWLSTAGKSIGNFFSSAWEWLKNAFIWLSKEVVIAAKAAWNFILAYLYYIIAGAVILALIILLSTANRAKRLVSAVKKGFYWLGKEFLIFFTEDSKAQKKNKKGQKK